MKKAKRPAAKHPASVERASPAQDAPPRKPGAGQSKTRRWWPWAVALGALFLVFEAYTPALNGAFMLDDRALPFDDPHAPELGFASWVGGLRPLLMSSYWLNFQAGGVNPYGYHATNVFLHFLGSAIIALVALRLLSLAGIAGVTRTILGIFTGALFLLHPLQTESVAYVASRSEVLSTLLYFSAFAIFLYASGERKGSGAHLATTGEPSRRARFARLPLKSLDWLRALAIVALFGLALSTKEHTLTLPLLLVLADAWWGLGGIRKNGAVYALLALLGAGGAVLVWRVLTASNTAGFHVAGLTPATYFFTQCRVVWMYVRLFFLPYGQNVDPDIPISATLLDHGAIFALAAWIAVAAAAWIYRQRFPLGSFGVLMFLLLIAPTSTVVPIRDVLAERRLYLPFLGLALVCLEFLRRLDIKSMLISSAAVLLFATALTYQRSAVWETPLALWQDTVAKSPQKQRPRFQLAYAYYEQGQCPQAAGNYELASHLGNVDAPLLLDWGLALDCAGREAEALDRLRLAAQIEPSAHVYAQIGMVYAKQRHWPESLQALQTAEQFDPRFEMTYVYRGNLYEVSGDRAAAAREYRKAVGINPHNQTALEALVRVSR